MPAALVLGVSDIAAAQDLVVDGVLPQATRTVLPPMSSIFIALTKNSAIAGAFSYSELFNVSKLLNDKGYAIAWIFLWTALAYLIITFAISGLFRLLERRMGVAR